MTYLMISTPTLKICIHVKIRLAVVGPTQSEHRLRHSAGTGSGSSLRWERWQAAGSRTEEAAGECDVTQGGGNPGNYSRQVKAAELTALKQRPESADVRVRWENPCSRRTRHFVIRISPVEAAVWILNGLCVELEAETDVGSCELVQNVTAWIEANFVSVLSVYIWLLDSCCTCVYSPSLLQNTDGSDGPNSRSCSLWGEAAGTGWLLVEAGHESRCEWGLIHLGRGLKAAF